MRFYKNQYMFHKYIMWWHQKCQSTPRRGYKVNHVDPDV